MDLDAFYVELLQRIRWIFNYMLITSSPFQKVEQIR